MAGDLLPATSQALCQEGEDSWWLRGLQSTSQVSEAKGKLKEKKKFVQQSIKSKYSFGTVIDSTPSPEVPHRYLNHLILLIHKRQVRLGWVSPELQIYYWDPFCEDK